MSGIVGILNLDGAPADPLLLQQLTNSLVSRGPDAQRTWIGGPVGFGHTMFKTTEESENECQPLSLGNGTWIVADARVDAQRELIEQLKSQGQQPPAGATDAELILRAYHVWGEACLDHLLGDFAFGIWDGRRQKLFCARDHMGVKPLYYAQTGSVVVFSSSIDCIRECPGISDRLNDLAIADFLLFGMNQDLATTSFADIQRLPPAHSASWSSTEFQIKCYWTMPIDEPVFYQRKDDYCDRFKELMHEAVGDRLRTRRLGVFMSGGLDSPTLAAIARDVLRERYTDFSLLAITDIDDFKPEEGHYAGLVAKHLGIPIHYDKWDDRPVDPTWERACFHTAEPYGNGWDIVPNRIYRQKAGSYSRVFFWGDGPDGALLPEWRPYVSYLKEQRLYGEMLRSFGSTIISQGRPPFWGRLTHSITRRGGGNGLIDTYPTWLNTNFESRLQLRTRWQQIHTSTALLAHPVRPEGYASLQTPAWHSMFEGETAGPNGTCFEMRYPFVDLRVLRFLLAVPSLPWSRSKYLLRRAMRGKLPDSVLRRKKKGLPSEDIMKRVGSFGLDRFAPAPDILDYVDPAQIPDIPSDNPWLFYGHLRVRSFNHWLHYSKRRLHNIHVEG